MTAVLTLPPPTARAAREIATLAFWRAARFGMEAALRDDPVVAADCCHTLEQIARSVEHGAAPSLARRAAAARARIATLMAAIAATPPTPVRASGPDLEGWLRLWMPWL